MAKSTPVFRPSGKMADYASLIRPTSANTAVQKISKYSACSHSVTSISKRAISAFLMKT
jgi:hypothetical protein